MNNFWLFFLGLFSFLLITACADPTSQQELCTDMMRSLDVCSKNLEANICSFFTGEGCDSEDGVCQRFTLNACTACSDTAVNYFYPNQACDSEKVFCDANNRPESSHCDLQNYEPVCGYYTEGCPLEICAIEATNACFSCMNQNILYFKPGRCDVQDQVFSCDYIDCGNDPSSGDVFKPVCGIKTDCTSTEGNSCELTFKNECTACATQGFEFYKEGVCEEERIDCDINNRPINCTSKANSPVCAFFADNYQDLLFTTVDNSCEACFDSQVMYYIPGECPSETNQEQQQAYCLPNNRPENCPDYNETVCGYYEVCEADSCFIELQNPCAACMHPEVKYYEHGSCKKHCVENENYFGNSSQISPVCATYDFGSQALSISLKNSQIACNNFGPSLEFYKEGLCPGDQGLRCEFEFESLYGRIDPVCAVFQEGCNSTICRDTYAEPMVACKYADPLYYLPGVCPEDEGISCNPYRSEEENDLCDALDLSYGEVCGFSRKNCKDDSCMVTFQNHCDACSNSQIKFFKAGPCS